MIQDTRRGVGRSGRDGRIALRALLASALAGAFAPAAEAQFTPGHLFVAGWKKLIYEVDPVTWTVTTFADQGDGIDGVSGMAWTPSDELLVASYYNDKVISFDAAGTATTKWTAADGVNGPFGQNALAVSVGGITWLGNWDARQVLEFQPGAAATVFCDAADGVAHVDGMILSPYRMTYIANRDGKNVLRVQPDGTAVVFDTLPDQPMSVAMHPDGTVYVACLYGDIYRYLEHSASQRSLWISNGRRLATPVLRFSRDYSELYFTSSGKGNLVVIDPATATQTEVLPTGTFATPLGIEVVGGHDDIGIHDYGYEGRIAGSGDMLPSINCSGSPVSGFNVTLELRDFVGAGQVHLITAEREVETSYQGGVLFADITGFHTIMIINVGGTPGVAGDGDLDYTDSIGVDPAIDGKLWTLQAYCPDPTANNNGISLSNAVRIITRSE
jgi:streptogramin lyase